MHKGKLWALIAAPSLAMTSLLLAFLLLGQNTVGAASDGLATVTDIQSFSTDFIISATMVAANGAKAGGSLDVCGGIWVTETVDSAGNVGSNNSLALAPTYPYTPYISYHDYITGVTYTMKYAWLNGTTWVSETVDSGGQWTSLALVPTHPYTPFIVHHHWWEWDLKYACGDGTTWITNTVLGGIRAIQGSLALEPVYPYMPHVTYYVTWGTAKTLDHAYLSGTTWCSGTWVREHVEPPLSKAGKRNSLALESTYPYTPHVSYFDGRNGNLKYAWKSGTTWFSKTVDSTGNVGDFSSLILDSSNNPHIAYYDDTNTTVKYARLSGNIWVSETVDSVAQTSSVRRPISLDLNQADVPYIGYYDADNGDVKLAYLSGTVWITQTVASAGKYDQFISLALDRVGCPHISYYDPTNDDLKYAYLPPIKNIYLPIIMKN